MNESHTFLFDGMLGSLCRKMSLLGFDSKLNPRAETGRFLINADKENRLAVTLSRRKTDRPGRPPLVLLSVGIFDQITELLLSLEHPPELKPFTRCLECNQPLLELPSGKARLRVPDYIAKAFNEFMECPECGRVYWKGTHFKAMSKEVEQIKRRLNEKAK